MSINKNAIQIAMVAGQIAQQAAELSGMKIFAQSDLGNIMGNLEKSIERNLNLLQELRFESEGTAELAASAYFNGSEK